MMSVFVEGRDRPCTGRPADPNNPRVARIMAESDAYEAAEAAKQAAIDEREAEAAARQHRQYHRKNFDRLFAQCKAAFNQGLVDMAAERRLFVGEPAARHTVWLTGGITEASIDGVLAKLFEQPHAETITVMVDSWGGDYTAACRLYGALRACPGHVITHAVGKCHSAAVTVFLAGKERRAFPRATFATHEPDTDAGPFTAFERIAYTLQAGDGFDLDAFDSVRRRDRIMNAAEAAGIGIVGFAPGLSHDELRERAGIVDAGNSHDCGCATKPKIPEIRAPGNPTPAACDPGAGSLCDIDAEPPVRTAVRPIPPKAIDAMLAYREQMTAIGIPAGTAVVISEGEEEWSGTVMGIDGDQLFVDVDGECMACAISDIGHHASVEAV